MCNGEVTAGTSQKHQEFVERVPAAAMMDNDRQSIRILVFGTDTYTTAVQVGGMPVFGRGGAGAIHCCLAQ